VAIPFSYSSDATGIRYVVPRRDTIGKPRVSVERDSDALGIYNRWQSRIVSREVTELPSRYHKKQCVDMTLVCSGLTRCIRLLRARLPNTTWRGK
jgi:hypothetical protein